MSFVCIYPTYPCQYNDKSSLFMTYIIELFKTVKCIGCIAVSPHYVHSVMNENLTIFCCFSTLKVKPHVQKSPFEAHTVQNMEWAGIE